MEVIRIHQLHQAMQTASAHISAINDMLKVIRDHVAPMISERDLAKIDTRSSVRERIAIHPTLRRASMAKEAALSASRQAHRCLTAAQSLLEKAPGNLSAHAHDGEANHWAELAFMHVETIGRARAAVTNELERVKAGIATIVDQPPPVPDGTRTTQPPENTKIRKHSNS
jgi:hypothetical protein